MKNGRKGAVYFEEDDADYIYVDEAYIYCRFRPIRLCVMLPHCWLHVWVIFKYHMPMRFYSAKITHLAPSKSYLALFAPIHIQSWPKV